MPIKRPYVPDEPAALPKGTEYSITTLNKKLHERWFFFKIYWLNVTTVLGEALMGIVSGNYAYYERKAQYDKEWQTGKGCYKGPSDSNAGPKTVQVLQTSCLAKGARDGNKTNSGDQKKTIDQTSSAQELGPTAERHARGYTFKAPAALPNVWPPILNAYVKLRMCDTQDPKTQYDIRQIGELVYNLPRGVALIVNNRDFNGARDVYGNVLYDRHGTDLDATSLYETFQELGLTVRGALNCKAEDILKEVYDAAKDEVNKSCFICVVLSHGANGIVYGVDGKYVSLAKITNAAENTMPVGPKIFIIQACQGAQRNCAVTEERDISETKDMTLGQKSHPPQGESVSLNMVLQTEDKYLTSLRMMEKELAKADKSDSSSVDSYGVTKSAIHADIFIAIATVEGYVSWRNGKGSWFIQAFVYALKKWAHCDDIDGIFTRVTNLVLRQEHSLFGYKQVAMKRSTLCKKFFFFPGITEEDVIRIQASREETVND